MLKNPRSHSAVDIRLAKSCSTVGARPVPSAAAVHSMSPMSQSWSTQPVLLPIKYQTALDRGLESAKSMQAETF